MSRATAVTAFGCHAETLTGADVARQFSDMPFAPKDVFEVVVAARLVAGVRVVVPRAQLDEACHASLDRLYATAQQSGLVLDGPHVVIYRDVHPAQCTVDIGVGVRAPFTSIGDVIPMETPSGVAAMTSHRGDDGGLADAHAAIVAWCRISRRELAGPSWEVYGPWQADPAQRRVDVYYLLHTNDAERALVS